MPREFDVRRIVVKVGTSCLVTGSRLDRGKLKKLVDEVSDLRDLGKEVILVTSGAIAAGLEALDLKSRPPSVPLQQAAAAIGQGILMHEYKELFNERGYDVAQLLLTQECFSQRERYIHFGNTLTSLLRRGIIPIINENDAIAVDELDHQETGCFGDNDKLSALVAGKTGAGLLIMLSDVDGLYDDDPRKNPNAKRMPIVEDLDKIKEASERRGNSLGRGGLEGKIEATHIATKFGIPVVIVDSKREGALVGVIEGKDMGTVFLPKGAMSEKKRWISYSTSVKGSCIIDEGAMLAITKRGARLLPAGVIDVLGEFERRDVINIIFNDKVIARGLTNYPSEELGKIKGHKTSEMIKALGYEGDKEVINRDNMVVL